MNTPFSVISGFILRVRAKMLFGQTEHASLNFGRLLLVLLIVIYALLTGLVLDTTPPEFSQLIEAATLSGIALTIIISGIFPALKIPSQIVPSYAPLNIWKTSLLNFIYHFFRPGTIYGIIFLLVILGWSAANGRAETRIFSEGLLLLVTVNLMDMGLKQQLKSGLKAAKKHSTPFFYIFAFISAGSLLLYFFTLLEQSPLQVAVFEAAGARLSLLLIHALSAAGLFISSSRHQMAVPVSQASFTNRVALKLQSLAQISAIAYGRRRSSRIVYAFILISNIAIAAYIYFFMPAHIGQMLAFLLVLPLIPFTFVHNNFWGLHPELWLSSKCSPAAEKQRGKLFLGSLWRPLLLHTISGFSLLYIIGYFDFRHLLVYLLACPQAVLLGYWCSIRFPRRIDPSLLMREFSSFKNQTSARGSYLLLLTYLVTVLLIIYTGPLPAIIYAVLFSLLMYIQLYRMLYPVHRRRTTEERLFLKFFSN